MANYWVHITQTGERYRCDEQQSVLSGMEALGRKGIPVGCRQGGCGVCKVAVVQGDFVSRVMSRDHVSESEEAEGRVLACRIRPTSDLCITVLGAMKRRVCEGVALAPMPARCD